MKKLYQNLCLAAGLIAVGSSMASENPLYQENLARVSIPAVSVDGDDGLFQDIKLSFKDANKLELEAVRDGVLLDQINKVEVFLTNTNPVQAFLEITGDFPTGCGDVGRVLQSRTGNTINVSVYYENDEWVKNPSLVPCTQAMRPFKHVVQLDVYGLQRGAYTYNVNGEFSGNFTLDTDNVLP